MILLLLSLALAEAPSEVLAETVSPPVSLGAFRAAFPAGTTIRMRMTAPGQPVVESLWRWVEVNAEGGTMSSQVLAADGTVLEDEGTSFTPWMALMGHARFPKAQTVVSRAVVEVPGGRFETTLYTVTKPREDGVMEVHRYHFVDELPGPPVQYTTEREGVEVFRMEMVSRRVDQRGLSVPPDPVADALAEKIEERAGDPGKERGLAFNFVVKNTVRKHRWDIQGNRVEVRWETPAEQCTAVLPMNYAGPDPKLKEAWSMFVNDQYWLLAATKVQDPGVIRTADGNDLRLFFQGVGLTPGDSYLLHANEAGDIVGWEYVLESGRSGSWSWSAPTEVGGLRLSLERTMADRSIRFQDVRVGRQRLGKDGVRCEAVEP
jgi:hypothetical protein